MIYLKIWWGFHHIALQSLWEQRQRCKARSSKRSAGVQRLKSILFLWGIYNQTIKEMGSACHDFSEPSHCNVYVFYYKLIMQLPALKLDFSSWALIFYGNSMDVSEIIHCSPCCIYFTTQNPKSEWVQMQSMLQGLNTTKNHNSNHHQNKSSSPRNGAFPWAPSTNPYDFSSL